MPKERNDSLGHATVELESHELNSFTHWSFVLLLGPSFYASDWCPTQCNTITAVETQEIKM